MIGAIPGAGAVIAAFVGYAEAKRRSKKPDEFGAGSLEGVAAAEAANNAVTSSSLIPMLTLGVPGSVVAAVVGYVLVRLEFSLPPLVLGMVLGPLAETALRRSLLISGGTFAIFVTRPISAVFLALALLSVVFTYVQKQRRANKNKKEAREKIDNESETLK